MALTTSDPSAWAARVRQLEDGFRTIEATRMAGMPVLNTRLHVQAVGFEPEADSSATHSPVALGVLITPWFMNLLRLPLYGDAVTLLDAGCSSAREVGAQSVDFIGASEPLVGRYELCSLYSPLFEFADQTAAVATATEVLRLLRQAPQAAPGDAMAAERITSRRGFLFGRSAGAQR